MDLVLRILISIGVILFLILALPFLMVSKLLEKPIIRTKAEVMEILNKMALNQTGDHLWDEFLSIPIKNRKLNNVRENIEVLWAYEDFQSIDEKGNTILNKKGLARLNEIITELDHG